MVFPGENLIGLVSKKPKATENSATLHIKPWHAVQVKGAQSLLWKHNTQSPDPTPGLSVCIFISTN